MEEVKEPFNTKYPTWIIAFCPDTNSFFVTNERYFFWESEQEFDSENDGIDYFEHNVSYFIDIANKIIHTERVWLENTSKWYESWQKGQQHGKKGFESEHAAEEFAAKTGGTVRFSPLPDYMGVIPYWTVVRNPADAGADGPAAPDGPQP